MVRISWVDDVGLHLTLLHAIFGILAAADEECLDEWNSEANHHDGQ